MSADEPLRISSRENTLVKELRRLAQDKGAYRKQQRIWLEGDHLCRAALQRGVAPTLALFQESCWEADAAQWPLPGVRRIVLPDALFAGLSGLESPGRMAFVVDAAPAPLLLPDAPTVVLDGLQDPGNVGAILRSASAFGFRQVLALRGTVGLWSPKVLRAGMGAHFGLSLLEGLVPAALEALKLPLLATSSHRGAFLHQASPPWPCAWILGHEGQGVSSEVEAMATGHVRIVQPGGEESLNVAAAAAICLHASAAVQAG